MSQVTDSGWRYYIPERGETAEDAVAIKIFPWQSVCDAEDAATQASEDDWDHRDGSEAGIGDGPIIVVISPEGHETRFQTTREVEISHSVSSVETEIEPL